MSRAAAPRVRVNSASRDYGEWMWRLRADDAAGSRVRMEIYTVPGWAPRLRRRLMEAGIRSRVHGRGTLRVKGVASLVRGLEVLSMYQDIVDKGRAYAAEARARGMDPRPELVAAAQALLVEDERRHAVE